MSSTSASTFSFFGGEIGLQDSTQDDGEADLSSEDEAVASDLDMHSLILSGLHADAEPVKTAEEVIREIDDMMQVSHLINIITIFYAR